MKKYFFYAIGEIILVVIGILIAFQIDTWNDNRIEFNRGTKYLVDLREELERNKERLEYHKRGGFSWTFAKRQAFLDSVAPMLTNPRLIEKISIEDRINIWSTVSWQAGGTLGLVNTIYQQGISTDMLSNISTSPTKANTIWDEERIKGKYYYPFSNNLVNHIHFYYTWMSVRTKNLENGINKITISENKCSEGLFLMVADIGALNETDFFSEENSIATEKFFLENHHWLIDFNSIENKNARNYISIVRLYIGANIYTINEYITLTDNLIVLLDKEIELRQQ